MITDPTFQLQPCSQVLPLWIYKTESLCLLQLSTEIMCDALLLANGLFLSRQHSYFVLSRLGSSSPAVICGSLVILHLLSPRLYPAHQCLQKNPQSNPLFPNKVLDFPDYMSAQSCQTPSLSLLTSSNLSARKNKFSSMRFFTSGRELRVISLGACFMSRCSEKSFTMSGCSKQSCF